MESKNYRRPKHHKSAKVMWLSAQYRIEYKRDRKKFIKNFPEVLQMSTFDQQYILTYGELLMDKREEHCAFRVLDSYGKRCIAICHRCVDGEDCIGEQHVTPIHEFESDLQARKI